MTSRYIGWIYLFFVSAIGIIFGTVFVQMLPHAQLSDVLELWGTTFIYTAHADSSIDSFWSYFLYQIRPFVFILIIGMTILGYPIAILIHFLKAFLIGSSIQLFIFLWEDQSVAYIFIWIIPSSLFIFLALIILLLALARYSYNVVSIFKGGWTKAPLLSLARQALLSCVCVLAAAYVHTYLSPQLFELYISRL